MHQSHSTRNKTTGSIDKSGTSAIDVPGGDAIHVNAEYIDTTTVGKSIYYLNGRTDGIDFIVTTREVIARSDRAQALLEAHTNEDTKTLKDSHDDQYAADAGILPGGEA